VNKETMAKTCLESFSPTVNFKARVLSQFSPLQDVWGKQ